jgi:hypothetical protein
MQNSDLEDKIGWQDEKAGLKIMAWTVLEFWEYITYTSRHLLE